MPNLWQLCQQLFDVFRERLVLKVYLSMYETSFECMGMCMYRTTLLYNFVDIILDSYGEMVVSYRVGMAS